jgi:hypothetical protein
MRIMARARTKARTRTQTGPEVLAKNKALGTEQRLGRIVVFRLKVASIKAPGFMVLQNELSGYVTNAVGCIV